MVRADDVAPVPWKNGGGLARDLLFWPTPGDWQVRISLADIAADGPFSAYPGVRRWFAVVEGAGVALDFEGGARTQREGDEPLAFDGGDAPVCRLLAGPTRDLNLMLSGSTRGVLHFGSRWDEDWPLRGRFDIPTRTLEWGLPPGPLQAAGPALWIGVAP